MSPEQIDGTKYVDYRTDLWALAVIAYRCLTGRLPFDSTGHGDLAMQILVAPLPVPSETCPGLPEPVDGWWIKAASRDPELRHHSALALVQALEDALEGSDRALLEQGAATTRLARPDEQSTRRDAGADSVDDSADDSVDPTARDGMTHTPEAATVGARARQSADAVPTLASAGLGEEAGTMEPLLAPSDEARPARWRAWMIPAAAVLVVGAGMATVARDRGSPSGAPQVGDPLIAPAATQAESSRGLQSRHPVEPNDRDHPTDDGARPSPPAPKLAPAATRGASTQTASGPLPIHSGPAVANPPPASASPRLRDPGY
jgi:serine/threonine-protein kinase